jgi:hypothetical protein
MTRTSTENSGQDSRILATTTPIAGTPHTARCRFGSGHRTGRPRYDGRQGRSPPDLMDSVGAQYVGRLGVAASLHSAPRAVDQEAAVEPSVTHDAGDCRRRCRRMRLHNRHSPATDHPMNDLENEDGQAGDDHEHAGEDTDEQLQVDHSSRCPLIRSALGIHAEPGWLIRATVLPTSFAPRDLTVPAAPEAGHYGNPQTFRGGAATC